MERREFLAIPLFTAAGTNAQTAARPRVAVIMTTWFPNSHADVFVSRLLDGYRLNGTSHRPRLDTVSFYVDQFPVNDMAREQAEEFGIRIFPTIAEALRMGGDKIAVDGVAVIGEHGQYMRTARGSFAYPRRRFFDEVTKVMEQDGRVVPLLNDKYFAYDWDDATQMAARIKAMRIPFGCGSTLPLTWRRPPLAFASGTEFDELLAVSYSDLEEHAYHAIELLQAMAERRKGGESGVARIRCVEGEEVWRLADRGEWSRELLDAALRHRVNPVPEGESTPQAILIRYKDGLKATILNLNSHTRDYLFAARVKGKPSIEASCFYIQLYAHNHWSFMVRNFEQLVLTRQPQTPMERTLLSTGITLFGLQSRLEGGTWIDTPGLDMRY